MFRKLNLVVLTCVLFFSTPSFADQQAEFHDAVQLHRKIIFLISQTSTNVVASERDTFIARNFYYQKREILEHMEEGVLADAQFGRDVVKSLVQFSQSDSTRAADALVFIDLVDVLLYRQSEEPFLSTEQLSFLHKFEQKMQLIQQTYSQNMAEISSALATRGLQLEPWQDYLNFLNDQFDINEIYAAFNQSEADLAEPATRGSESKKDASKLVWGFGVPEKTVVLTFDDGPHHRNTGAILDVLKEHEVKGYFFAVGKNIGNIVDGKPVLDKKAALLKRAVEEGHILANHSYSHAVLTKLDESKQKQELSDTSALLTAVSGETYSDYRPPYGSKNDALLQLTGGLGMRAIMWNIDSQDWADPVPDSIVNRVMGELAKKKRGILLFHDIHKQTVQALPKLLTTLKEQGYKVVTIDGQPFTQESETVKVEQQQAPVSVKSELYGESWALVVGVNKYRYWPQLSYAVNDAEGVAQILQERFGFKEENIFKLYDEKATRENISEMLTETLSDPSRVKPNDRVFVFYAGHGMTRTLPSGRSLGYIIPVDAELNKFSSKSISMTHLHDFSDMIPAKHVYFVMDSCYSGIALTRGANVNTDSNYLSEVSSRRARQILTAGGADQEVADGGPNGHSIFTWSLLQGLKGEADLDNNQIISATELGAYIAPRVADNSNQTPAFGNLVGSEGGDFLFELAPSTVAASEVTEEQRLRNTLLALQKENARLKQQLASMQTVASAKPMLRGAGDDLSSLSPSQRKQKANEYHEQGLALYRDKQYKASLVALRLANTYNPANVTIVNDYGFVLYRDGQYKNALAWLEKTIEMDAERVPVYLNIADTLVALDREAEAVPYYEYYLEQYPDSPLKDRVNTFLVKQRG